LDCEYVEQRDGGYYIAGSRVSLASILHQFQEGSAPETIRQSFPTLSLEQVYGAIAFYLGHQKETENYLQKIAEKWEQIEHDARLISVAVWTKRDSAFSLATGEYTLSGRRGPEARHCHWCASSASGNRFSRIRRHAPCRSG
jgi:uncharacterized protein (DUF433 family)